LVPEFRPESAVVVMDSAKSYPSPSVVVLENLGALCRTMLTYIGGTKILAALVPNPLQLFDRKSMPRYSGLLRRIRWF